MTPPPADPGFGAAEWPRIAALFDEALTLPPDARPPWLAALAGREPQLSPHVARLLAAHGLQQTRGWLEDGPRLAGAAPTGDGTGAAGRADLAHRSERTPGQAIGPYELLAPVACGGMGEVWRARALRLPGPREVALKLPLLHRPGAASAARFEREGAILATLEHPHIARLYDAGQADDGTPYLALEWVVGEHLVRWCEARRLGVPERLRLFLQVLEAVAFAHARLVLHRDLKPSNILVGADGRVKLLDFGIAKLLDTGERSEATELTRAAGRVMTPAYAAPEQLRGDTLTPATDVYALGVLLFELLTGERPYRLRFHTPAQLEQAIEAGDLRRPGELRPALRGDIDAIVGRALAREPARRYAGAQAMAEDIERHLSGQPVLAQPQTWAYLAGRLVRRHRAASAGVAVALAALVAGGALAGWQALRAERERDRAVAAGALALASQRFMRDLLDDAARAGQPLRVSELMARAETLGRRTLAERPDDLAGVLAMVAAEAAGRDAPRAAALYAEAASQARQAGPKAAFECAAQAQAAQAASPQAAKRRLRALLADAALDDAARTTCGLTLAQLLLQNGEPAEAEPLVEAAWQRLQPLGDDAWRDQVWALTMQTYLRAGGRGAGLDARVAPTLARLQRLGRDRSASALGLYNTWGTLAMVSGEPARAAQRFRAIVQRQDEDLPPPGAPAYHLNMLANALNAQGLADEADALLARSIGQARAQGDGAALYNALCLRGRAAALRGQAAAAGPWFDQALALPDRGEPLRRNARPFCEMARAEALVLASRPAEALPLLAPLLGQAVEPSLRLSAGLVQAEALLALGRPQPAAEAAAAADAIARRLQADNRHSARTGQALALRALAAQALGDAAGAAAWREEARAHLAATTVPAQRWQRRLGAPAGPPALSAESAPPAPPRRPAP